MLKKHSVTITDRPLFLGFNQVLEANVTHETFSGNESSYKRELITKGDSVVILVIDPEEDSILLVEQFRIGAHRESNPWTLELPAGMIDPGETAIQAAVRELKEECNITVLQSECKEVLSYYPSVGTCDEKQTLVVCTRNLGGLDCVIGGNSSDEDIKCHVLWWEEVCNMIKTGKINTAGTIAALALYQSERLGHQVKKLQELYQTITTTATIH